MQGQRGGQGQRRGGVGCGGCLAVIGGLLGLSVVLFIFFRAQITNLGLSLAGVETLGNTQAVLAVNVTPVATVPPLTGAVAPEVFSVQLPGLADGPVPVTNNQGVTLETGQSSEGYVAVVTTTEADFVAVCLRTTPLCGPQGAAFGDFRVSNLRPDFSPGAVVLAASVNLADVPLRQDVGLVFRLNAAGNRFELLGVDLNGYLFPEPPPEVEGFVREAEAELNRIVSQIAVEAGGARYTLDRVVLGEGQLELLLK